MTEYVGPACEGCGEEPGLFMIIPPAPGVMGNFGYLCLLMLGLTSMAQADVETLDEAVKAMGYQVSAAEKKKRKDAEIPAVDGNRTIAEIVESGPRDDGGLVERDTSGEMYPRSGGEPDAADDDDGFADAVREAQDRAAQSPEPAAGPESEPTRT